MTLTHVDPHWLYMLVNVVMTHRTTLKSSFILEPKKIGPRSLLAHPHLPVRATSERFLPARAAFRAGSTSENHWSQPVLVLTVH